MASKGEIGTHSFNNQSAFNNILRTIQEQPDDSQKKLQDMIQKLSNNLANHLEEAGKVCNNCSRLFPPNVMPIVAHSASVFRSDAASIRTKYPSVVQTASKLHAAIRSAQAEGRIVLRALQRFTDSDSESVKTAVRKAIEESNRNTELMLKHIREHLPGPAAARKSRTGNRRTHSSYARPGGVVRTASGVRQKERPMELTSPVPRGTKKDRASSKNRSASSTKKSTMGQSSKTSQK